MTPTEFAQFKYQHTDAAVRSVARLWFVGISLALGLILLSMRSVPLPLALFAMAVPAVAWFSASRHLLLGPRYLLCGRTIVYYANVKRLTLSRATGTLRVQSNSGQDFVLERDKFPTGARKADKIKKNKAAKFDKVADKIIDKVRKATTSADLIGV
ncbi:MAG: hypothetical protein U1E84_14840 [Rhodoferax sp.]